ESDGLPGDVLLSAIFHLSNHDYHLKLILVSYGSLLIIFASNYLTEQWHFYDGLFDFSLLRKAEPLSYYSLPERISEHSQSRLNPLVYRRFHLRNSRYEVMFLPRRPREPGHEQ